MRRALVTLAACMTAVAAWTAPQNPVVTRKAIWQSAAAGAFAVVVASSPVQAETLPNGVTYQVKKKGDGPQPEVGELAAIRFAAYNGAIKIDDIFDTPEPYYTRIGSGGLLKGVEQVLPLMKLGDRWELTIPSELAFGKKGRPASAGKPRISGDATIVFDVEMVGLQDVKLSSLNSLVTRFICGQANGYG